MNAKYKEWVSNTPDGLRHIPNEDITGELISLALTHWGARVIRRLEKPSKEVLLEAIEKCGGHAIEWMLSNEKTQDILEAAIKRGPCLRHKKSVIASIENPSEELCRLSVSVDSSSLEHITNPSMEVIHIAVQRNPRAIQYVKSGVGLEDLCFSAIVRDRSAILYVDQLSEQNYSKDFYLKCIQFDPSLLEFITIPEEYNDLYQVAVKIDGLSLEFIPFRWMTLEMCELAVENNWRAIKYIGDRKYLSERLCIAAYDQDITALSYISPISLDIEQIRSFDIERRLSYDLHMKKLEDTRPTDDAQNQRKRRRDIM